MINKIKICALNNRKIFVKRAAASSSHFCKKEILNQISQTAYKELLKSDLRARWRSQKK